MNERKQQILALIARQPGIRDVEISDAIDIDLDQVHRDLADAVANNDVWVEKITALNGLKVNGYSRNPAATGWKAPEIAAPVISPPAADAPVVAHDVKELTKVDKAIAYLKANGSVTASNLGIAMGLDTRKYSPTQYLGHAIKSGRIVKDGNLYRLGGGKPAVMASSAPNVPAEKPHQAPFIPKQSAPAAALIAQYFPVQVPSPAFACALNSNGELLLEMPDGLTRLNASQTSILRNYFNWIASSNPFPPSTHQQHAAESTTRSLV